MADTIGNDAGVDPRGCIAVTKVGLFERHLLEVTGETANEDSGLGVLNLIEGNTTRLERFVDHLEEFPLLRVHPHRLHG